MENTPEKKKSESQKAANPDRRKLLKLLAAGGAVTAASMLPGKWSSPVVKTGVLPAHAQVTPTPTPTPEYEIRCGEWGWEVFEDEISFFEFFGTATAWDITNNVPVPNVRLNASAQIDTGVFRTGFADTDANGVANITITANIQDVQSLTIEVTVSFDDPQYGDDTCTTQIELPQPA